MIVKNKHTFYVVLLYKAFIDSKWPSFLISLTKDIGPPIYPISLQNGNEYMNYNDEILDLYEF